ncbi:MAG: response regulator [Proteobacteria bacterium]|nr:response regulator [Pseudomonadota bacterium]
MRDKTILLVEDNADDSTLAQRALKRVGMVSCLVIARDGSEALDYLFESENRESKRLLPAVVILDLSLPKITGFEVLERVRADDRTRTLPVVVLSSSAIEGDIERSYQLGANSYVQKPVASADFRDAVQQIGSYWFKLNETSAGKSH